MHIPDGFLNATTWVSAWLTSAAGLGLSIRRVSRSLKDKTVPLMGVMAAFIFAAQMLNFPVFAGTSGHLLGGVLAAVMLGPGAGAIIIAVVLVVQCLIFQDGGLTALGANILNMSFVGTMGGWAVFVLLKRLLGKKGVFAAVALAAWASMVMASAACAVELAVSGIGDPAMVFPAMLGIHALIGIGEAVITVLVLAFIIRTRPDLVEALRA